MNSAQVCMNFIWTSREFRLKFIWNTNAFHTKSMHLIFHTNFIWSSYELHTNVLLISYQIKTSFTRNSYEHMPDISYQFHKKFIWTSYELHTNFPKNSREFPQHYVKICASSHVIHMKFIWHMLLKCQMQIHMIDNDSPSYTCHWQILKNKSHETA